MGCIWWYKDSVYSEFFVYISFVSFVKYYFGFPLVIYVISQKVIKINAFLLFVGFLFLMAKYQIVSVFPLAVCRCSK